MLSVKIFIIVVIRQTYNKEHKGWSSCMLNILLSEGSYFQRLGLSQLITEQACQAQQDVFFLLTDNKDNANLANIIFYDDMVTINIFNRQCQHHCVECPCHSIGGMKIYMPLFARSYSLDEISFKLKKLIIIADYHYCSIQKIEDILRRLGLKKYSQLSVAERRIMQLIGRGYDYYNISRILGRSNKTVSTHCRNIIRKMGGVNHAQFYRYASLIARQGENEMTSLYLLLPG